MLLTSTNVKIFLVSFVTPNVGTCTEEIPLALAPKTVITTLDLALPPFWTGFSYVLNLINLIHISAAITGRGFYNTLSDKDR